MLISCSFKKKPHSHNVYIRFQSRERVKRQKPTEDRCLVKWEQEHQSQKWIQRRKSFLNPLNPTFFLNNLVSGHSSQTRTDTSDHRTKSKLFRVSRFQRFLIAGLPFTNHLNPRLSTKPAALSDGGQKLETFSVCYLIRT